VSNVNLETPIQSVVIARANQGTGDGGTKIPATSAAHRPDVLVTVLSPARVVFIRAGKAFFDTFAGSLGLGVGEALGAPLPITEMGGPFYLGFVVGISAAAFSIVRSLSELFGKLDQKYPSFFGGV